MRWLQTRGGLAGAIAMLLALLAPTPAVGQFGMMGGFGGMGDMTEMAVSRRSMSSYCELLGMGEVEREAALALHEGYLENFKQTADRLQRQMEGLQREVQETRDFSVFQDQMPAMIKEFMERMKTLEDGIFADLRMLADVPETEEGWIRVERMRRREQARQSTMISGDAVDLIALVERLETADELPPEATAALLRYEVELDSVLAERQALMERSMETMIESMEDMFDDAEQAETEKFWEEFMTKSQELGRKAKGINARYAAELQRLLPEGERAEFDRAVKRDTWPAVYKESYPERLLDTAEGMADLTGQQRDALVAIRRDYEASAEMINVRWAGLIDKREESAEGFMGSFTFAMDDESEESKAKAERKELDEGAKERIRGVLTEAQQERLPGRFDIEGDDGG